MTEYRNALDTMSVMCEDRATRDYAYPGNAGRYAIAFALIELVRQIKRQIDIVEQEKKDLGGTA